jgi:hypothetical protein
VAIQYQFQERFSTYLQGEDEGIGMERQQIL